MKNATNVGMLMAVVFAVGMVGFNLSDGTISLQNAAPAASLDGASMMGHMEIIHTDEFGNILSYQQTDNAIVSDGRNCTASALFGHAANPTCTDTTPGPYNIVGIGNGTDLTTSTLQTDLTGEITDNNMERKAGTVSMVSDASGTTADPAVSRVSAVFTWLGGSTNTVDKSGLFNSTTVAGDSVFAMKQFPSDVTMNTNDQLTVNWDITIDGSDDMS